ncbi:MAG: hypothetical protein KBT27_03525 [Prevotellaceae bacterium]|nr:hypothetical protein [Candidatus Faecinaster equi]
MYKKAITYEDFEGNKVTEELYFNMTETEVVELEAKTPGGVEQFLKRSIDNNDTTQMFDFIKALILKSYGKKSDDNRRFLKSDEIRYDFEMSPAFSELFMQLITSEDEAATFMNRVIPKGKNPTAIPPKT